MSLTISKDEKFHNWEIRILSYNQMNNMRKQNILCDVSIRVGTKHLSAHKVILASHCEYFDKMFTGCFRESSENEIVLNGIEPSAFEIIVDYMYTSSVTITQQNVKGILLASKFILFDDLYDVCVKFMKRNMNVESFWEMKHFASANDENKIEELCSNFMLENFTTIKDSSDFLDMSFEEIVEIVRNNDLNAKEEKIYESIMSWLKHDLDDRCQYTTALMSSVKMPLISSSYFLENVENEEVLRSGCKCLLYDALKMYMVEGKGREIVRSDYYSVRRNSERNRLIVIASGFRNNKFKLEWLTTGYKSFSPKKITWNSQNSSIILQDGRIFCTTYHSENNKWSVKIFDGKTHQWNLAAELSGIYDGNHRLNLVELDDRIYLVSSLGGFKCFDVKENKWINLNKIDKKYFECSFDGLVVLDKIIFYVSKNRVLQYCTGTDKWLLISPSNKDLGECYATCSLDGFLYVLGGMKKFEGVYRTVKTAKRFHPSTKTWSSVADMILSRSHGGAVAVNGSIYMIGGQGRDSYEIYDPKTDKWAVSTNRLGSADQRFTRAFVLRPEKNINPENISNYYSMV